MITKNTDGNTISQGFIDEIRSDAPNVIARLWHNGAELPCDIVSITVEKGSCGSNPFMIGEVIGDLLTATVKNLTADIKGEIIECHIGALVNGDYEYISLGKFTVSKVMSTRYQSEITAYSSIVANSGNDFDTSSLVSTTIANLAVRLQSDLGCTIAFDNGIDTTLEVTETLAGLTDYQVLQVLAIACGGYIVNDIDGNILVKRYNATPTLNVDTGMMVTLPEFAEKKYKVRNIGVLVSDATTDNEGNEVPAVYYTLEAQEIIKVIKQGTEYYLVDHDGNYIIANARPETADVYFQCAYMTQEMFEANIVPVVGYEYSPATVGLTLGDPRLEGSDVLQVEDVDGTFYAVPCHKVVHKYTGGFTSEIKSADASDEENKVGTEYPITQRLQNLDRQTGKAQATANNAYQIAGTTRQYFWFTGTGTDTGAHITEIPQEQWNDPNSPYYHTGGNLLARSNGIAVRKGLTELATFGANGAQIGVSTAPNVATSPAGVVIKKDANNHADITGNGLEVYQGGNSVADFSANTRVGASATRHIEIKDGGLQVYQDASTVMAHIGYGSGNTQSGGQSSRPYYSFGERNASTATDIGNWSMSEGLDTKASGFASHAEGQGTIASGGGSHAEGNLVSYNGTIYATTASGGGSHAEGYGTLASGGGSHAEGMVTTAEGYESHAEGYHTLAHGNYSHAGGNNTIANGNSQTAIGEYNVADTTSLFIVGNGGADSTRSNGFVVDSNGNVRAKGSVYAGCNADSTGGTKVITEISRASTTAEITAPANGSVGYTFNVANLVSDYTGWVICYCNTQSSNVLASNYWHASSTTVTAYFRNLTASAVTTTAQLVILRWK